MPAAVREDLEKRTRKPARTATGIGNEKGRKRLASPHGDLRDNAKCEDRSC